MLTRNLVLWTFPILLPVLCFVYPTSPGAQSTLDSLSSQIAERITREEKSSVFPKVAVIDFPNPTSGITALSAYLADQLSASLENKLPPSTLIPRRKLVEFLQSHRLSPLDLQSVFVAYWAADNLGANEILYGEMSPSEIAVGLDLKLLRIGTGKDVAHWKVSLPAADEILNLKDKPLDLAEAPDGLKLALRCDSGNSSAASQAFIKGGGTLPKPIRWPNPPFSQEARREKLSTTRPYHVFIDEQGNTVLVIPPRPLRPEFDDIALQTLKAWKSQPATKDGQPVRVCVFLEVNWRYF